MRGKEQPIENTEATLVTEVNDLLTRWRDGDRTAYDRLITLLHSELLRLAHLQFSRERNDHTLQTNDLVSKLYLKLLSSKTVPWQTHAHFLNSALRTMRQIMIDHARSWSKRADGRNRATLDDERHAGDVGPKQAGDDPLNNLLALDAAMTKMEAIDPEMAHIADLRLVLGLTLEETARELSLPINKVKRDWLLVRKFLAEKVWQEHGLNH